MPLACLASRSPTPQRVCWMRLFAWLCLPSLRSNKMAKKTVDAVTIKWCRNRADYLAAKAGYRFEPKRGQFACDWILEYCSLYEGVARSEERRVGKECRSRGS